MDRLVLRQKLKEAVGKYGYVAAVLLIGIVLMVLPSGKERAESAEPLTQTEIPVSEQLERILSCIEGVGEARVLLTERSGSETLFQTDEDGTQSSDSESLRVETVVISDTDRGEYGLVRRVDAPVYQGAIVVCQGGDRPSVQLSVAQAVSNATGISTDRITVLKMK